MKRIIAAGAALALFLPAAAVLAQQPSKGKDAPAKAAAPPATASTGKALYPTGQFDLLLKERLAQGQATHQRLTRDRRFAPLPDLVVGARVDEPEVAGHEPDRRGGQATAEDGTGVEHGAGDAGDDAGVDPPQGCDPSRRRSGRASG